MLVIEEAHALPIPILKHLKRFFELEDGFKKLLSIILLGQPELGDKLSERLLAVREVAGRDLTAFVWLLWIKNTQSKDKK